MALFDIMECNEFGKRFGTGVDLKCFLFECDSKEKKYRKVFGAYHTDKCAIYRETGHCIICE